MLDTEQDRMPCMVVAAEAAEADLDHICSGALPGTAGCIFLEAVEQVAQHRGKRGHPNAGAHQQHCPEVPMILCGAAIGAVDNHLQVHQLLNLSTSKNDVADDALLALYLPMKSSKTCTLHG